MKSKIQMSPLFLLLPLIALSACMKVRPPISQPTPSKSEPSELSTAVLETSTCLNPLTKSPVERGGKEVAVSDIIREEGGTYELMSVRTFSELENQESQIARLATKTEFSEKSGILQEVECKELNSNPKVHIRVEPVASFTVASLSYQARRKVDFEITQSNSQMAADLYELDEPGSMGDTDPKEASINREFGIEREVRYFEFPDRHVEVLIYASGPSKEEGGNILRLTALYSYSIK